MISLKWQYQKKPSLLTKRFGEIALQLGDRAEKLVEISFERAREKGQLPEWIRSWKHAEKNSEMDRSGTDFAFITDVGPLCINIKSSRGSLLKFYAHHDRKKFRAIVVDIRKSEEEIYRTVLAQLESWRTEKLGE